jgi:hypothetical protein
MWITSLKAGSHLLCAKRANVIRLGSERIVGYPEVDSDTAIWGVGPAPH